MKRQESRPKQRARYLSSSRSPQHSVVSPHVWLTMNVLLLITWGLLCGGCAKKEQPQTPEDYLRLGDQALGSKRETQARKYYEQLLEQHPDSDLKAQAQFKIADALYRERNYLEARFEYQKFLELYPLHPLASRA